MQAKCSELARLLEICDHPVLIQSGGNLFSSRLRRATPDPDQPVLNRAAVPSGANPSVRFRQRIPLDQAMRVTVTAAGQELGALPAWSPFARPPGAAPATAARPMAHLPIRPGHLRQHRDTMPSRRLATGRGPRPTRINS